MKIMDNLRKIHTAVVLDTYNGATLQLGDTIKNLAVDAMNHGLNSDEWRRYMSLFADNPTQLEHLSVEQATDPDYIRQSRAYIVSNAMCDAATDTKVMFRVSPKIDDNVPFDDENLPKPIAIPPIPKFP